MIVQFQCKKCKGINVSLLGWVNPNSMECTELIGDMDEGSGDNFCNDCDENTGLERANE